LELLKKFSDTCAPIFEAIHANETQAQSLATIYDTLLPRLISGELRLSEVENKIEAFAA